MGTINFGEAVDALIADGTQVSNTVNETIICPDFNIPAYFMAPGRRLHVRAWWECSNVVTTPGNLTLRLRWGGVAGVVLAASAAMSLNTTARTNFTGFLDADIVCRSAGSSGSFSTHGFVWLNNAIANVSQFLTTNMPQSGTSVASVDTTVDKLLSVTAQFSVATNPTNLTCQDRIIEVWG
jgi:hypothetical protein